MTENSPLTFRVQIHFQDRLVSDFNFEQLGKKIFISGPWWFGCPKTKPLFDDGDNSVEMLSNLQFDLSEAKEEQDYISFGAGNEDLDVDTNY